jgi:hypothetical protein
LQSPWNLEHGTDAISASIALSYILYPLYYI